MLDFTKYTNELILDNQGFYTNNKLATISYPAEGSDTCLSIEEKSFWFNHRKNCILNVVKSYPPIDKGPIFDIGGGNGYMTQAFINESFYSVLVEPSRRGVINAKHKRGIQNSINCSFQNAGFLPDSIPAISTFDVIEHIDDDIKFIQNVHKVLKKGGRYYLTVPAYNWLWSSTDDIGGHFRRYTCKSIENRLKKNGFTINYSTYIFCFLPIPIFLLKSLPYKLSKMNSVKDLKANLTDHQIKNSFLSNFIEKLMNRELQMIKKLKRISFGGSCLICATKVT